MRSCLYAQAKLAALATEVCLTGARKCAPQHDKLYINRQALRCLGDINSYEAFAHRLSRDPLFCLLFIVPGESIGRSTFAVFPT